MKRDIRTSAKIANHGGPESPDILRRSGCSIQRVVIISSGSSKLKAEQESIKAASWLPRRKHEETSEFNGRTFDSKTELYPHSQQTYRMSDAAQ
jgi:hypothetical protein